ncbi:hypothetical protein GQ473_05970 [archaeon]|nr:hypothetical protein [archaeon]
MQTRKAQTLTPDFIISFVIFLAILTLSINLWNIANEKNTWVYDLEDMQLKARITADTFITRPGEPKDWNNETVVFIGFSDEDHILNKTKLISFKNLDYAKAKRLMNVGPNEFSLTITDKNNNIISLDGIALNFSTDYEGMDYIAHSSRLALINDSGNLTIAKVNFVVWRDI